ncbi:MAG: glycosyltransferase [Caldilineales bacterium]|nr:glycosyltransferase [Caldilineales bacterium]
MISILLPVKNAARHLAESLSSIAAQDYPDYELIIIYADSQDETEAIIHAHPWAQMIHQSGPAGLAAARNEGLARAKGDLIAFMAADDLWPSYKLQRQAEHFRMQPGLEISVPKLRFFIDNSGPLPPGFRDRFLASDHAGVLPEAMMVKRTVFDKVGCYKTDYATADDVDWLMRAKEANIEFGYIDDVLLMRRIHDGSISHSPDQFAENRKSVVRLLHASLQRRRTEGG